LLKQFGECDDVAPLAQVVFGVQQVIGWSSRTPSVVLIELSKGVNLLNRKLQQMYIFANHSKL